jgi:hypothetical protein
MDLFLFGSISISLSAIIPENRIISVINITKIKDFKVDLADSFVNYRIKQGIFY